MPVCEHTLPLPQPDQESLVLGHLSLADTMARRYARRGQDPDDLVQVARLGLLQAARRYDPCRGNFISFAAPTVTGELKRHFRDRGWLVRPPRAAQELQAGIEVTWSTLNQELGRDPSIAEIAHAMQVDRSQVAVALTARDGYHGVSLDHTTEAGASPLAERLGTIDPGYHRVEVTTALSAACRQLSAEDRALLHHRFVEERSQSDIAAELGTNQMAISRRLSAIMNQLRDSLTGSSAAELPPHRRGPAPAAAAA